MKNNSPPAGKGPHRDPAKEQSWRNLLKQFAASGQSVREFCDARQLKESALYFWRSEIQRREGQAGQAPARRQRAARHRVVFTKVLVPPPVSEDGLRLRLHGGRELLLPASWPVDELAAFVHAIERSGDAA